MGITPEERKIANKKFGEIILKNMNMRHNPDAEHAEKDIFFELYKMMNKKQTLEFRKAIFKYNNNNKKQHWWLFIIGLCFGFMAGMTIASRMLVFL